MRAEPPLRRKAAGTLGALISGLCLLALAGPALAGPPSHLAKPDPIGGFALDHACGVAVDSEGDIYVSNADEDQIEVFDPSGAHLASISNTNEPCGLAVDTHGTLFVTERGTGEVVRYAPSSFPFVGTPTYGLREAVDTSGEAAGIAVDTTVILTNSAIPTGGDDTLFVAAGDHVNAYRNEKQTVNVSGAGTFTLEFEGQVTASLDCSASHQEVQEALRGLSTIGPGGVSVTTTNFSATDHLITFTGRLGLANVPPLVKGGTCSVSQSETNGGPIGPLAGEAGAEYSGVAAYTYQLQGDKFTRYLYVANADGDTIETFSGPSLAGLKHRRTIEDSEAGEELEFGAAGGYLAVDRGNGHPGVIEAGKGTDRCNSIDEQACTAGHLLVYDEAANAVEEYDATGEFLDRIESDDFADAEPTGLAIDRSGGGNDGTIYATAGSGSGAKLFAFGPLVTPTRPLLESLSHVLTGARAVTVDEYGDVYVAAGPTIHVFDPEGNPLTTITDARLAYDLAVDSDCNVYVLDGTQNDEQMAYYQPSACPPGPGSSFTRHEPAIVPSTSSLRAVAEDAETSRSVLLKVDTIVEFEPVETGSTPVRECNPGSGFGSGFDVGIYNGPGGAHLYVARSGFDREIITMGCGATEGDEELITSFNGGGCLSGTFGTSPKLAVDQSNGHVLQFQPSSTPGGAAREYDATGACVAEYGEFAEAAGSPAYAIAVDNGQFSPNRGTVYVAYDGNDNTLQPYDLTAFGPLSYGEAPQVQTIPADAIGPEAATLNGTVDPSGFEVESCSFEYLLDSEYEQNLEEEKPAFEGAATQSCAEGLISGEGPIPVHADITGLSPSPQAERYRFRLIAENKFGQAEDDKGLFGPPQIATRPAQPILYREATLQADVDPSGLESTYRFAYGTDAGPLTQSTPTVTLPPGEEAVAIKVPLTGLAEGAAYRFQLIVENEAASLQGPEQGFETLQRLAFRPCPNAEYRNGLSSQLPDCRAYELVTPADSGNAEPHAAVPGSAGAIFNSWLVAPRGPSAGESVAYFGFLPGRESEGNHATRAPGAHPKAGWQSEPYGFTYIQRAGGDGSFNEGLAADQRYWLWHREGAEHPGSLPLGHYLQVPPGTANAQCNVPPNDDPEAFYDEFELVGCGSLGTDRDAVSRFVSPGGAHLVFSSEEQLEPGAPGGVRSIYDRQAGVPKAKLLSVDEDGDPFGSDATYVGASEDGSTVLFGVAGALYAHRGGQTAQVTSGPHTFAGISEDGAYAFYTDSSDEEAPAGLYRFDVQARAATQIATDALFLNVSPGGSGILFTSEAQLTGEEESEGGDKATAGQPNLYAWAGGEVRFLGILDPDDFHGFGAGSGVNLGAWAESINQGSGIGRANSPTRATPDGKAFLFQSHAKLTEFDNQGVGEIYRYEPGAPAGQRLLCVSCDPTGAPPTGDAMLQLYRSSASQPTTLIANLTDDGRQAFFQSPDRLLPGDANSVADVYQWRARGAGQGSEECKRPAGCLALISSGQGEVGSYLYGMSASGSDVLFTTSEKLVGADLSGSFSIYDARVEGGIPDPPAPAPCQGDACQGRGSTPPALTVPSPPLSGGDVLQRPAKQRCPKGKRQVKRKGKLRCVKRKRAHKHKQRKHRRHHRRAAR